MKLNTVTYAVASATFAFALTPAFAIVIPVTPDGMDPDTYAASFIVSPGTNVDVNGVNVNLNGVVQVSDGSFSCTGALISATQVLTAAHCIHYLGVPNTIQIGFQTPSNPALFMTSTSYAYDPAYDQANCLNDSPACTYNADLAIVNLPTAAPGDAAIYSLFTGTYAVGSTITMVGFGNSGNGQTGFSPGTYGYPRVGQNVYDTTGANVGLPATMFLGDFDSLDPSNNAFISNPTGLDTAILNQEVMLAPGDSGGPSFYKGQLIGIHDITTCFSSSNAQNTCLTPPSYSSLLNSSNGSYYGQIFGDTSVAGNIAFINDQLAAGATPEPATWLLWASLLPLVTVLKRRKA